jgi:hypothetical protein
MIDQVCTMFWHKTSNWFGMEFDGMGSNLYTSQLQPEAIRILTCYALLIQPFFAKEQDKILCLKIFNIS